MRKKLLFVLFFALLVGSISTPATAYADEIDKRDQLIEKGIPSEVIERYSDVIIDRIYYELCVEARDVMVVESSTLYEQAVARGEINPGLMAWDVILMVDTTATSSGDRIDEVLVMVANTWYNRPVICRTDSVAVNWDSSLFTYIADTFSLSCYGKEDGEVIKYNSSITLAECEQGGLGYYVSLNEALNSYDQVESLGTFILGPAHEYIYQATEGLSTSINAQYVHSKNPLGIAAEISAVGSSVGIDMGSLCDYATDTANIFYHK